MSTYHYFGVDVVLNHNLAVFCSAFQWDRRHASSTSEPVSPLQEFIPMVLQVAYTLASKILPSERYVHVGVSILGLVITYAFAQGRTTDRERDLHARTIIVTVRNLSIAQQTIW